MDSASNTVSRYVLSPADQPCERYLVPLYSDLRRMARRLLRREGRSWSVVPTGLVHDTVLRLLGLHSIVVDTDEEFLGLAAAQMRRVLVDHARRRQALKRTEPAAGAAGSTGRELGLEELLVVEELMDGLREADPRAHAVTHLHIYLGLTFGEAAASLGVSEKTALRDWEYARTWLYDKATRGGARG